MLEQYDIEIPLFFHASSQGITPTCVGKSIQHKIIPTSGIGSLPRVWEKVPVQALWFLSRRITPTCVGKRLSIHGQNKHFKFILSWNFLQQIPRISALSKSTHLHIVWKKIFAQKILYKVFCAFFAKKKTREFHAGFDTYYLFFQYLVFYCVNSAFNSFF